MLKAVDIQNVGAVFVMYMTDPLQVYVLVKLLLKTNWVFF